jgi:Cdc6-like AAA superfamily ATPase
MSKKLKLLSCSKADVIEVMQDKKMVLMIDDCGKLIEHDQKNFFQTLIDIVSQTTHVKVVLIPNKADQIEYHDDRLESLML